MRPDAGHHHTGSTSHRILELLDALWGEWIGLDSLTTEYLDRFGGVEGTVARKFYLILKDPPPYLRVRWVESRTDDRKPFRQVFVDNPYAREESHAA